MEVGTTIERTVRTDWSRILASLTKSLGNLQLAEDCLQDAVESALHHWGKNGIPNSPPAWLIQTARRKAIDRIRRQTNFQSKSDELTHLMLLDEADNAKENEPMQADAIPDHRLEMIFTCCHPAIEEKSRLALTLRTLGGLTTDEIARAFLDRRDAMAARLTRAKKKIALANIAYEIPKKDQLPDRLATVLGVIYLIFNEGYQASEGAEPIRKELSNEALRLAGLLRELMPDEPESAGLHALLLLHDARRPARLNDDGGLVSLEAQDRTRWDQRRIDEGIGLLKEALAKGRIGPYQLQAAISACHCEAKSFEATDWPQIVCLYRLLENINGSPVVSLNRILAESRIEKPEISLSKLEMLAEVLGTYQPYYAARADLLARAGETEKARLAYEQAIRLSNNMAEKTFLADRMERLGLH